MQRKLSVLYVLLGVVLISSCSTPQISYFQDVDATAQYVLQEDGGIKLEPGDKVSVIVNTKDQEYNNMYNLPYMTSRLGQTSNYSTQISQGVSCYTIGSDGYIDFPILGRVKAEGLTREQLAQDIKENLLSRKLLQDDPLVVTVEFANLTISILGEVNRPGRYNLDKDRMSVLEALSLAGDMTVLGERENIMVMRKDGDKQTVYTLNMTSMHDLVNSPAYYVQQNDIIYVKPNDVRERQSTVNGNNVRSTSFWISLASLLTSVALLIVNL